MAEGHERASWNKVGQRSRKRMGGRRRKRRRHTVRREAWGVQDRNERKDRGQGKVSGRRKVDEEGHLKMYGVGYNKDRNENVVSRPSGLRTYTETALSCRRPRPARRKKEVHQ